MARQVAQYVPELKGIYGPRLWVRADSSKLKEFCELTNVWTGPVQKKVENDWHWFCYEFPFGAWERDWLQVALSRLNVQIIKEGEDYE